jgi:hypothetical protein
MAAPEPIIRHLKVEIDTENADVLRALIQSLAEALTALTDCAQMATEMASSLLVVEPTRAEALDTLIKAGVPFSDETGHGVEIPLTQPLDTTVLMGDVPMPRMPVPDRSPTPPRSDLQCPECQQGKRQNCTTTLENGHLCSTAGQADNA